jgi:hypothetical protein
VCLSLVHVCVCVFTWVCACAARVPTTAMELGEYAQVFRSNKIDGELLSELEENDLIEV